MRHNVLLSALFLLIFIITAAANQVSVHFCVDTDLDERCGEEFTKPIELNGLKDMDLLEMALEDELKVDNWEDILWAVSIEGSNKSLPQFDGAHEVHLEDGDEVNISWTGWRWYLSSAVPAASTKEPTCKIDADCDDGVGCTLDACVNGDCQNIETCLQGEYCNASTGNCEKEATCKIDADCDDGVGCTLDACVDGDCQNIETCAQGEYCSTSTGNCETAETPPSGGSTAFSSNAESTKPGTVPSGSAEVTAVSSWLKGYSVEVDGIQVGVEGTGSDVSDGVYIFYVAGNRQHSIKVNHPQFWKSWDDFFVAGGSYTANIDVPGRVAMSS
jgi:hypothetical protein